MLDARTSYARGMVSLISNTYGNSLPIFNAQIPYSVRASEISALGCSIYERDFTIITNAALRDTNLSLKAKGLLALMLSEHDGWNFTIKGLSAKCKEGVDAVAAIIKELEAQAMSCAAVSAAPPAILPAAAYTIYEKPIREAPKPEKPVLDKPAADKPSTVSPPTVKPVQRSTMVPKIIVTKR